LATTRNEFSLFGPIEGDQGYGLCWMKFPEDLAEQYPVGSWRTVMEWKEPDSGKNRNRWVGTNNWWMNVNLRWDEEVGMPYWMVHGQHVQPLRQNEWTIENRHVPVPAGEWFQVEVFWLNNKTRGRLYFAVNRDEVRDYHGRTEHATNPLPLKFWSIFKLYHGQDWLKAGPPGQGVEDVEIRSGFRRGFLRRRTGGSIRRPIPRFC
jgi:hypothetical protein